MEIVIRIALVFVLLTLALRVMGKRELSQLSPFELVMLLLVAEIVAPALTAGDQSLTAALFGAATLFTLSLLHSILTYNSMYSGWRRRVSRRWWCVMDASSKTSFTRTACGRTKYSRRCTKRASSAFRM